MPFDLATAGALSALAVLVWLPGHALLALAPLRPHDAGVRWGLAAGLGLAIQPLAYLWLDVLHVPMTEWTLGFLLAISAAVVLWDLRRRLAKDPSGRWRLAPPSDEGPPKTVGVKRWSDGDRLARFGLGVLLLAALSSRWWAAHTLTVPLFGDSVHHATIVRLFLIHQGLPNDWQPLVPLSTFSYHFGFHALVASVSLLTGLSEARAILVTGQALMVLQVLTLYALAAGLSGKPWVGLGAALAASGLSPMPGFYLNWGRYTQLAGQVILPAAALAAVGAAEGRWGREPAPAERGPAKADDLDSRTDPAHSRRRFLVHVPDRWRLGLVATILVAGLALTHYVVAEMLVALVAAWWLLGGITGADTDGHAVADFGGPMRRRIALAAPLIPIALLALLVVLPWLPRVTAGHLASIASAQWLPAAQKGAVFGLVDAAVVWGDLQPTARNVGFLLLVAVLTVLVWPGLQRRPVVKLGATWLLLLFVAAYPATFGLPLRSVIKDFTVAIGLYLPLGLMLGGGLGPVRRTVPVTIACLALGMVGFWIDRAPVQAQFMYVTPADEKALAWIQAETPPEAVFLVSGAKAFGDTVVAGDDGGWWLPLVTGRRSTLPPITYGLERTVDPEYRLKINALFDAWHDHWDSPETLAALDAFGVTHAYVGPTAKGLDRALLAGSPHWRKRYEKDGAQVFERTDKAPLSGPPSGSR